MGEKSLGLTQRPEGGCRAAPGMAEVGARPSRGMAGKPMVFTQTQLSLDCRLCSRRVAG